MDLAKKRVMPFLEATILVIKVICIVLWTSLSNLIPKRKKSLKGKIIVITGAGHGLGKELAIKCAEYEAYVVLWDINEKSVLEVAKDICHMGYKAKAYVCDITNEVLVQSTAKKVLDDIGDVDILINNAGIYHNVAMDELPLSEIRQVFEVNVIAQFQTIRAFLPRMMENNRGHLVSISSAVGLIGVPFESHYSASKFAIVGMMESLSEEIRGKGKNICCTVVCPVIIDTGMMKDPFTKHPSIMPILTIDEAVNETIDAIRKEKNIVTIPYHLLFFFNLRRLFSQEVTNVVLDYIDYFRTFTPKIHGINGIKNGTYSKNINHN